MADIAELKTLIQGLQAELAKTAKQESIDDLLGKLATKDETIGNLEKRIENLEARVAVAENTNALLIRKNDDLESYARRQNLRIVGIPEPEDRKESADACIEKVKEEILKLGDLHMNLDWAIDRAHRVGPKKNKQGQPVERAMIVRFTSWRARTNVYTNRKKGNNEGAKFYTDLTKRRFDLKKKAEEKTRDNEHVKFAYADINNNICLMMADGSKKFINSENELDNILRDN